MCRHKDLQERGHVHGTVEYEGRALAAPKRATNQPELRYVEDEKRDGVDATAVYGVAVGFPNVVDELVRVEEGGGSVDVEARLFGRSEEGGSLRGAGLLLKVPFVDARHKLFLKTKTPCPDEEPLRVDGLPVRVDVEVELDPGLAALALKLLLRRVTCLLTTTYVAEESVMPGRRLVPLTRG